MKLVYIAGKYIEAELPGVDRKIQDQILVFEENGIHVERAGVEKRQRLTRVVPFFATFDWKRAAVPEADCLYIRMELSSFPFIRFIRKYKRQHPKGVILLEFPTYPYDVEIKRLSMVTRIRDKLYRRFLKKYADRAVTYSDDETIFGIQTIRIRNGTDVQRLPVAKGRPDDGEIHLLAVAALQAYHGYERIIEGLHEYYSNGGGRDVRFLIVGSGYAENELRETVKRYNLEGKVTFFGAKTGKALTDIYDLGDIGVGSFGLYKRGESRSSALKTREYLSRGLPMISGCTEDVFEGKDEDFYLEFENNEKPVDIRKVAEFYDKIYSEGKENLSGRIREFAEKNIDVRSTFRPVAEYVR